MLIILALMVVLWWMVTGRWPWQPRLTRAETRHQRELARARTLLALPAKATRSDIHAAHRRLLATVHPDRGGSSAMVHRATAARDILIAALPPDPQLPSAEEDT